MNTRQCPFDGCTKKIKAERFACYEHWITLTQAQKDTIWNAYRQWQGGVMNSSALALIQRGVLNAAQGITS